MFYNYFLTAFRNLIKNRVNTLISLAGLSAGYVVYILIALFVNDEFNYDQFHKNRHQIFRVAMDMGPDFNNPLTPMPFVQEVKRQLAEIKEAARVVKNRNAKALFVFGEKRFYETDFLYADPEIFKIFDFQFISGDARSALLHPNTVVITTSTAKKYFGDANPMDKIIKIQGEPNGYRVTAVVNDFPPQSHLHFTHLISFSSLNQQHKDNWLIPYMFSYLLLNDNSSPQQLEKKLTAITVTNFSSQVRNFTGMSWEEYMKKNGHGLKVYLQPLTDIHLHSNLRIELEPNGNYRYVKLFSIAAILVLGLSCINFINLSTANAAIRSKEVGVRKVLGAKHVQLVKQFLIEAYILCAVALIMAWCIALFVLPVLNKFSNKSLDAFDLKVVLLTILTFVITGLAAGLYPAIFLARLQPIKVFKNSFEAVKGVSLRRVLIVSQFVVSIGLIIGVFVVARQLNYMATANLGFDKELLIVMPVRSNLSMQQKLSVRNDLLQYPSIHQVSFMNYLPGSEAYENQDVFIPEGKPISEFVPLWYIRGDWSIAKTMGFEILAGRDFDSKISTDSSSYILNETAARQFGWTPEQAVGKNISSFGNSKDDIIRSSVIGVVRDFHFEDFTHDIKPMVIGVNHHYWWNAVVRITGNDATTTIGFLSKLWKKYQPDYPFEYHFVDQQFSRLWTAESKLTSLLKLFAVVAAGIACIGLFGLSVFAIQRKRKEIAIRKVLGASSVRIVSMMSREYVLLVLIAFAVSAPVAAVMSNMWLKNFAYRVSLNFSAFVVPLMLALAIAVATVSFKTVYTALSNPIKSLKVD